MSLVQDDHVIRACAANPPDAPLDVGVLSRTSWGNQHFCDSHVLHTLPKRGPIDPVPIAQQIPRGLVPRKGFHHLLSCPQRRGVFRDVKMDDAAPFMGQDEQHEEHCVGHRRHNKEIQSHPFLHVVLQQGLPRWRRRPPRSDTVRLHRRIGYVNAQPAQFSHDPGRAPRRVRLPHVPNQRAYLLGNRRTTRLALLPQVPPVVSKPLVLPGKDRAGLDKGERLLPTDPEA
jgi:hypothetical protein